MQIVVAMLGWPEIIGVLVIVLVLFGAKRVPGLFNGMKHGTREFMRATREVPLELADLWETDAVEKEGKAIGWHEISFWLLVAHVIAELCAAALGWG